MRYRGIRAARKQPTGHRAPSPEKTRAELMRHLNTLDKTHRLALCVGASNPLVER